MKHDELASYLAQTQRLLTKHSEAYQIKEDKMGGERDSSGKGEQCTEGFDGET
jgi:hypothetical protein